jgi:transposase
MIQLSRVTFLIKKDKMRRGGKIKTWISVVEGYRPGPGLPPKQRTVKSFGYLEDQKDADAFMAEVREFNANFKKDNHPLRIEADGTLQMYSEGNRRQNYGYKYLEAVFDMLRIGEFIEDHLRDRGFRGAYKPAEIFKFLVLLRILSPDPKRASFQMKDGFYEMDVGFELSDVYRALDQFADFEVKIQRHLNEMVKKRIGRDLSHAFYDVTNYYFEIDFPNGEEDLRRRGVSKEHRVDPIAAMGLFMDGNGLPVSLSIFPGNTSENLTLQPMMKDIKKSYGLGRLVVVADKGLNTAKNINNILNAGDGFVFSQILRGTKGKRYHGELFNDAGWVTSINGSYRHKMFEEEYKGIDSDGKAVIRKRKVLLYWNRDEATKACRKREEKLAKAVRATKNNAYGIKKGVDEYVRQTIVAKETGEIFDRDNVVTVRSVDLEKAEKDAMFDGYFCIVTSELDYDEHKIRQVYGGLWRIEQSFRIMKSDLYARPVFVSKNEHIRAHFLICFVALLILRIIQYRMDTTPLSAERLAEALNAATCRIAKGGIVCLDDVGGAVAFKKRTDKKGNLVDTLEYSNEDEIALDFKRIQVFFGSNIHHIYMRQEEFNKVLKSIVVA